MSDWQTVVTIQQQKRTWLAEWLCVNASVGIWQDIGVRNEQP